MRPPIRVTTATQLGASYTSPILTFLEGIVTEIDFNSVPVGTAIDTHYTAEGVTFQLISKTGAGSVVTLNTLSVADPNDPKGSASNVIGGFKDDQATIRASPVIAGLSIRSTAPAASSAVWRIGPLWLCSNLRPRSTAATLQSGIRSVAVFSVR